MNRRQFIEAALTVGAAAAIASIVLSNVTFADEPCKPEFYVIRAGILKHTCDNRFYVDKKPLRQWLIEWKKNRKNRRDPNDLEVMKELVDTVEILDKRYKERKKGKKDVRKLHPAAGV